jgi:16S rRNA (adenine1518-N6/adenine1519-N6)-dimethyltransferase
MYSKKSLGQHFLKSDRALKLMVEAGQVRESDTVLEIGPGLGVLTIKLLETGAKVIAVEKDDQLYESLKKKFEKEISLGQLTLIHDDILNFITFNFKTYKLIANIPYNLTGAILKKFLGENYQPEKMVLLIQKEVAKRIVAQDGKESILSISVKAYGKPKYIETVKAGSFAPMPKVDSAIVAIENISKDFFTAFSEKDFFRLLKAGFQSKRKKISSNLAVITEKDRILKTFQKLGLDTNLRAENISLETWKSLTSSLGQQ